VDQKRDFSFEALAEVTSTNWTVGRGELNAALKSIREQMPQMEDVELAVEILYRAKLYREFMGEGIALTAAALAKHWLRVLEQRPKPQITNAQPRHTGCQTCDGMGMVLVNVREDGNEEWGICSDCRSTPTEGEMMFL
jgi:hypothetical protein